MASITDEQSLKPAEIILVKDGLLTSDLESAIGEWIDNIPILCIIPLDKNVGLGDALTIG